MRKQRKQRENILSDFLNRFSQISGRRPQRIAEFFACGKTGLSHRNHRNHRNPRKDDRVTAQSPNRQGYKERIKRQTLSISI